MAKDEILPQAGGTVPDVWGPLQRPASLSDGVPRRRLHRRFRGASWALVMVLLLASVFMVVPASALFPEFQEVPAEWNVPNNLTGSLTWKNGKGGIAWGVDGSSEDHAADTGSCQQVVPGQTTGQTCVHGTLEFVSDPLPKTLRLNISRTIAADVYAAPDRATTDVELYVDSAWLAGAVPGSSVDCDDSQNPCPQGAYYTSYGDYPVTRYRLAPEVAVLPAGSQIKVVLHLSKNGGSIHVGTGGNHQSFVRFHYFSDEEAFFRYPEAFQDSGISGSFAPSEPMASAQESWPATAMAGTSLAAIYPGWARRSRKGRTVLCIVLVSLSGGLAGCFQAGERQEGSPRGGVESGGELDSRLVPQNPEVGRRLPGSGSLEGFVRDDLGQPVPGAYISVVGTSNFTTTGSFGRFTFHDLAAGTYTLEVKRDGFKFYSGRIGIVAGNTTLINLRLERLSANPFLAHTHDYWGTSSRILAMDETISDSCSEGEYTPTGYSDPVVYPTQTCSEGKWFSIPLKRPGSEIPNLIVPGTGDVEVSFTWTGAPAPSALGLVVQANDQAAATYRALYPRSSGKPFHLQTGWGMTDSGHSLFTTWKFAFFMRSDDPYLAPAGGNQENPNRQFGPEWNVEISMVLHRRGAQPIESPHLDHWDGNQSLVVDQTSKQWFSWFLASVHCVDTAFSPYPPYSFDSVPVRVIPQETEWIEYNLKQNRQTGVAGTVAHFDWVLLYRAADEGPAVPKNAAPAFEVTDGATNYTWRIPVKPSQADPWYNTKSSWQFVGQPDDPQKACVDFQSQEATDGNIVPSAVPRLRLEIKVTAHRDPLPSD